MIRRKVLSVSDDLIVSYLMILLMMKWFMILVHLMRKFTIFSDSIVLRKYQKNLTTNGTDSWDILTQVSDI
jgi:hypothetical protein